MNSIWTGKRSIYRNSSEGEGLPGDSSREDTRVKVGGEKDASSQVTGGNWSGL